MEQEDTLNIILPLIEHSIQDLKTDVIQGAPYQGLYFYYSCEFQMSRKYITCVTVLCPNFFFIKSPLAV